MKKREKSERAGGKRGFRLEWEENRNGAGTLYLFGVEQFGDYTDRCKSFQTGAGVLSVSGEGLSVTTFRSGAVEVTGKIRCATFTPALDICRASL